MLKFLLRIPGYVLRTVALVGLTGMLLAGVATRVSPEQMIWPAFFGLSYPFWLGVTLFGLVYALVRRRRLLSICLVIGLVVTGGLSLSTFGIGSRGCIECAPEENAGRLRVMSYNVRLFDLYNWGKGNATRDSIFAFLATRQLDVVCFQEFFHTRDHNKIDPRKMAQQLPYGLHIHDRYMHEMHGIQFFGLLTLSRYPIVGRGSIAFSSDPNNFCIYTDVDTGADTVRVFNAHFASLRFQPEDYEAIDRGPDQKERRRLARRIASGYKRRASQIEEVASAVEQSPYLTVVCADFNDTPVSFAYRRMTRRLRDTFSGNHTGFGGTHIGLFPFLRIDYILADPGLNTHYFMIHERVDLSDHHPVEAHVNW